MAQYGTTRYMQPMAYARPEEHRKVTVWLDRDAAAALEAIVKAERRTVKSAIELALLNYCQRLTNAPARKPTSEEITERDDPRLTGRLLRTP